jgi:hypothetical protein
MFLTYYIICIIYNTNNIFSIGIGNGFNSIDNSKWI